MKILVKKNGRKPTRVLLPTGLIFSGFTATIASGLIQHAAQKNSVAKEDLQILSAKNLRRLFRELRRAKKLLRQCELALVEMESRRGEQIRITL